MKPGQHFELIKILLSIHVISPLTQKCSLKYPCKWLNTVMAHG